MIRAARLLDADRIRAIEVAAGEVFRTVDMGLVASGEPPTDAELAPYLEAGRAWVIADDEDAAVAFALVAVVDGNAHLEQISVDPHRARQGLGRRLIDHIAAVARADGFEALTLTTYAEVPWNGPYYERLGFVTIASKDITAGLQAIRRHEASLGLDAWPRICMRRELTRGH
jgi:GNAT superfamily N-acetyltransferase